MALLQIDFFSESLMRTVTMNAIIPTDKTLFTQHEKREIKEYKALYLLHGGYGNYTDWLLSLIHISLRRGGTCRRGDSCFFCRETVK